MPFRPTQLLAAAIFACILLWYMTALKHTNRTAAPQPPQGPQEEVNFYDLPAHTHLLGHGVVNLNDPHIQISRLRISVSHLDSGSLSLLHPLDIKLPASTRITVTDNEPVTTPDLPEQASVLVKIPEVPQAKPDASEFIFGVSTTYERLEESLDTLAHWLGGTNAKLIGHMQPSLDTDAQERVLKKAQDLKISLGTIESSYEFLDRYFALVKVLWDNKTPTTKWFVFIDDDTFFLDTAKLIATFRKYDPSQQWYVGALSEDFQQMAIWGYMAYGGGGIFISSPLLEALQPHWDRCFGKRDTGDRMLARCIYRSTTTKFTWEPSLHQLDLHGDQSGFYEALRPQPLSVHHWKSNEFRSTIDMLNMSRVATVCGSACLLQKFRFKNDWILTNGFSLVKYSDKDLHYRDLATDVSMERTWDFHYAGTGNGHFEHSLGPIRNPDEGEKISFRMESALVEEDGRVRQLYVKRRRDATPGLGTIEGVVEIEWGLA